MHGKLSTNSLPFFSCIITVTGLIAIQPFFNMIRLSVDLSFLIKFHCTTFNFHQGYFFRNNEDMKEMLYAARTELLNFWNTHAFLMNAGLTPRGHRYNRLNTNTELTFIIWIIRLSAGIFWWDKSINRRQ
jgi:hypothetical protein